MVFTYIYREREGTDVAYSDVVSYLQFVGNNPKLPLGERLVSRNVTDMNFVTNASKCGDAEAHNEHATHAYIRERLQEEKKGLRIFPARNESAEGIE